MKATALEFRLRYLIYVVLAAVGFTAPWDYLLHLDAIRTWQLLAAWPARNGWISFSAATVSVLAVGIFWAFAAAALCTWASASLGASTVVDGRMQADGVVAAGPFRHVRNPLYVGIFVHTLALALLMPPSGAIVCIVCVGFFELRLIAGEEGFLTAKLGDSYKDFCNKVPRLLPALRPRVPASPHRSSWLMAFLAEMYFWGAAISFASLGWRYNSVLITQGVIVSLGVGLIARVFVPNRESRFSPGV